MAESRIGKAVVIAIVFVAIAMMVFVPILKNRFTELGSATSSQQHSSPNLSAQERDNESSRAAQKKNTGNPPIPSPGELNRDASMENPATATSSGEVMRGREGTPEIDVAQLELDDAKSAVGRAFPVSPSVARRCARAQGKDVTCVATREFLTKLSHEPRNILWARNAEERLERSILALGSDRFVIRALECRTSRCAVEVVGKGENYSGEIIGDPELRKDLVRGISTFGYERSETGENLVITVLTFIRPSAIDIEEEMRIAE